MERVDEGKTLTSAGNATASDPLKASLQRLSLSAVSSDSLATPSCTSASGEEAETPRAQRAASAAPGGMAPESPSISSSSNASSPDTSGSAHALTEASSSSPSFRASLRKVASRLMQPLRRSDSMSSGIRIGGLLRSSSPFNSKHSREGSPFSADCKCYQHGVVEEQGRRPTMEDHTCALVLGDDTDAVGIFGVFDGHGGKLASTYCKAHFAERLLSHERFTSDTARALTETCLRLDEEILVESLRKRTYSGTTVALVVLRNRHIYCCNVGDSRTVLCAAGGDAVPLSQDHSPMVPSEVRRIKAAGGFVNSRGVNGYISLTRALGDMDLKAHASRLFPHLNITGNLLIADPDVVVRPISPHDEFLIVACDGLWCRLSNQEAVRVARTALRRYGGDPKAASLALVHAALAAGSSDNVSVIVVILSRPDLMRDVTVHGGKIFQSWALREDGFGKDAPQRLCGPTPGVLGDETRSARLSSSSSTGNGSPKVSMESESAVTVPSRLSGTVLRPNATSRLSAAPVNAQPVPEASPQPPSDHLYLGDPPADPPVSPPPPPPPKTTTSTAKEKSKRCAGGFFRRFRRSSK
ncbi:hypothetical protein CDCA_CDCA04G1349 [Cyanidium caldarium]|uniref:PPM-type phosphatase domain-containing protein n=1 Tax=Cyanidium caldarium TaxID=2771 RepID=A0AAV9IT41_CYACA|nr:hypothetical protein CDCA_CDCA04G1349 [Cyanidium caldarium]